MEGIEGAWGGPGGAGGGSGPSGGGGAGGRAAERRGRLVEVVLQQRGLGEHRAYGQLVIAGEPRRPQRRGEHLRGLDAAPALERRTGAQQKRLDRGRRHGRSIELRRSEFRIRNSKRRTGALRREARFQPRGTVAV